MTIDIIKFMKTHEITSPCKLYYKGTWILRTTSTGIEVNKPISWIYKVLSVARYLWAKYIMANIH